MQLTKEQRTFIVEKYFQANSLQQVIQSFQKHFPERQSLTEMTIWRNVTRYKTEGTSLNLNKGRSGRKRKCGVGSPALSPSGTHLSPSPTFPTMLGNSLGGGPPPLPPHTPHQTSSSPHTSTGSHHGGGGAGSLSSLQHTLHGLHSLHNLQALQAQMAALAGLQGGSALGGLAPPPPHQGVSGLLHPHLHQSGKLM
ncbi:Protein of unknown function DUF4817 [Trinorchestia longiramus]|nr:Protein of unknown function DUF4817 [Trinorchestia longiramus]